MAKKKTEDVQPQATVENGSEQNLENQQTQGQAPKSRFETTGGNTLDTIKVFPQNNTVYVQASYGKLNPQGKTSEERRAGMRTLLSRPLTKEQAAEYQRLYAESPSKAKEFAVKTAYPMHLDDKAFNQKAGTVNGRQVDYVTIVKLTERDLLSQAQQAEYDTLKASDPKAAEEFAKANIPAERKSLVGKWQLSTGMKGDTATRFVGIMNREETAALRHRAVVTLDDKGQVKTVGKVVSTLDIAAMVETRSLAERQAKDQKLEAAKKVDWGKNKLPEHIHLTSLNYAKSKDPDRVWLRGKVNGIEVSGLLSVNETTALRNKLASLETLAASNKHFRETAIAIAGGNQVKAVTEAEAVQVVIARASDKTAKSFTPAQVEVLNSYAGGQDKGGVFVDLFEKAKPALDQAGVNAKWQEDTRQEMADLAQGKVRGQSQGMHR